MRRRHARAKGAVPALVLACAALGASAQVPVDPPADGTLEVLKVQGNVWLIAGAGGNIAVQAGDQGVIVVDTGSNGATEQVLAAIRGISARPIRYIINTSAAPQHAGGNAGLGAPKSGARPGIIAHEQVYTRMARAGADGQSAFPADAWPTASWSGAPASAYRPRSRSAAQRFIVPYATSRRFPSSFAIARPFS